MRIYFPFVGPLEVVRRRPTQKPDRINELSEYITVAEQSLRDRHGEWKKCDEYYAGEHAINKGLGVGSFKSQINRDISGDDESRDRRALNYIAPTVESMIPILRDAAPIWYYLYEGWDEVGPTLAQEVTNYCQAYWYYANMDHVLEEVLRDMVIYGTGFVKVYWDQTLKPVHRTFQEVQVGEDDELSLVERTERETIGDVAIEWCDPYSVYPDPTARRMDECRFLGLRFEVTRSGLERQFPKADEHALMPVMADTTLRRIPTEQEYDRGEMIEVWELYHEHGEELTIFSGDEILYDGENPVPNNQFPVVPFVNRRRGGHLWGHSEVGELIDIQDMVNLVNYRIARNQRFASQMQRKTNIRDLKSLSNEAGAIHYIRDSVGNKVPGYCDWDVPPEIPQSSFVWMQNLLKFYDEVSGIHEATQGIKPKGVTSGIAIAQLHEAGQARLRLMIASTSKSIEQIGQLLLDTIQANYAEGRTISYMGEEGPTQASVQTEALSPLSGEAMYRCVVQTKGELPLNPAAQLDIAIQLKAQGILDAEEVLKLAKWPNYHQVMERMAQTEMAKMQGQMAAQGGGPPGGGAGGMSPEQLQQLQAMMG